MLLKKNIYSNLPPRCGSLIVEVNIPQAGMTGDRRRSSALTPLQFPPHLISTRLHSTREDEEEEEETTKKKK